MKIGILSLQGAFEEHKIMLARLGADSFEIRQKKDLNNPFDGLIIPGGESTVMGKLLYDLDMYDSLLLAIQNGLPVFGTCAGLLLLAKNITGGEKTHFATMDIVAVRNAYGRQLGSFHTDSPFDGKTIPMTFIRAPYIESVGPSVEILSKTDGKITAARQKNQLVTAFHPELCNDTSVHKYFLNIVKHSVI